MFFNKFIFLIRLMHTPNHLLAFRPNISILIPLEKDNFHSLEQFVKGSIMIFRRCVASMMNTRFLIFNGSVEATSSRLYVSQSELLLTSKGAIVRARWNSLLLSREFAPDMSSLTKQILREY